VGADPRARRARVGTHVGQRMNRSGYVFISPLLLLLFAAFDLPLLYMLGMGFWSKAGGFTTEHYVAIGDAPVYLKVLAGTVRVSLISTLANVALGYPLAYWMRGLSPRGQLIAVALVVTPFWISVLVRTYSWIVVLFRLPRVRVAGITRSQRWLMVCLAVAAILVNWAYIASRGI
jgi:ABC-type spermidine/putrescine transport system permease subunit I